MKMTWDETINYIRSKPEYVKLVKNAYFDLDIKANVGRFRQSGEFKETLKIIKKYNPDAKRILDIGSGNGISSVAFALEGYYVVSVEPDGSDTIGAGAIRKLKELYLLNNLEVYESFAEEIAFADASFDMVYVRQAMHHANNLNDFVHESGRVLRKGGYLLTVRDHVIYDMADKELFLRSHPLHKFYGGENAFTASEYRSAMINAGLTIEKEWKYFDSPLNYWPSSKFRVLVAGLMRKTVGFIPQKWWHILPLKFGRKVQSMYNERFLPGRVYSYLAIK